MSATLFLALLFPAAAEPSRTPASPEDRALAWLAREVPSWPVENRCFSCHNSGVAASALYQARRLRLAVPDKSLEETSRWLSRPEKWVYKRVGSTPTDQALMQIQFATALRAARDAGIIKEGQALKDAARRIAQEQHSDGSWRVDADGSLGSPTTLGAALATHLARRVLHEADAKAHSGAIGRADCWLREVKVQSIPDAAGVLLALDGSNDEAAAAQKKAGLELLSRGQGKDGGWGPYATSPAEPFDTALALLALVGYGKETGIADRIARGRAHLVATQQDEGYWGETTRPAGGVSYAQRVATTGWALQALLATGKRSR
jgi:hypothetical protein